MSEFYSPNFSQTLYCHMPLDIFFLLNMPRMFFSFSKGEHYAFIYDISTELCDEYPESNENKTKQNTIKGQGISHQISNEDISLYMFKDIC